MQCVIIRCMHLCVVVIYCAFRKFVKTYKAFVCMLCVLILESLCGILVTGYCIFVPLAVDSLGVFNDISKAFCIISESSQ